MTKSCFHCKNELGFWADTFGNHKLSKEGYVIPEGFGEEDVICSNCIQSQQKLKVSEPVKDERLVSIREQTIFCFIPILNLQAGYRIEKLRKLLLLNVISAFGFYSIMLLTYVLIDITEQMALIVPLYFAWIPLMLLPVYYIRKWSWAWNKKIESENS